MTVDANTKQAFLRVASTNKTVWRVCLVLSGDWSFLFEQQSQLYEVAVDDDTKEWVNTQGSWREDAWPGMIDINYKDDGKEGAMQPLNHHKPQATRLPGKRLI